MSSSEDTFDGFEGTTDDEGNVSTDVPDGEYTITATHPDTDETVEDTVTVAGEDVEVALAFTEQS